MTNDEIKEWALKSGFSAEAPSVLAAPFRDAKVSLTFLRRSIRVEVEKEISGVLRGFRIGTYHLGSVSIDEHGILNGMGLGASFLTAFAGGDGRRPVWVPEAAWDAWTAPAEPPAPPSRA